MTEDCCCEARSNTKNEKSTPSVISVTLFRLRDQSIVKRHSFLICPFSKGLYQWSHGLDMQGFDAHHTKPILKTNAFIITMYQRKVDVDMLNAVKRAFIITYGTQLRADYGQLLLMTCCIYGNSRQSALMLLFTVR